MLKIYLSLLRLSLASMLEYRASIFIWMLTNVMPLVMLAVWYSLAEGGPISGYSQVDFVSYYLLLAFVRQLTNAWVIWALDYGIRHGDLSIKLLYPLNPIHGYIADHLTDKILALSALIPLGLAAWLIFPTIHYDLTPWNFVLFFVAMAAAWLIRFLSQFCIGLLGFWISESTTLNEIWYALSMMLGGIVAPLDLFPSQVQSIANYLPFRYMLSFPVEIVSGRLSLNDLVQGIASMIFWVLVTFGIYRWLWRKGITQFSAYGA